MKADIERECVRRLLLALGYRDGGFTLESPNPPAPDVRALWSGRRSEAFEVTEVHPDEVPGKGSAIRADEEQRARRNPSELAFTWIPTDVLPALRHRVDEKARKSAGYAVRSGESLSLLLVGALAKPGAVAATMVAWPFLNVALLNHYLHASLCESHFERAHFHLQLSAALWEWSRPYGWRVLREARNAGDGGDVLAMFRQTAGSKLLPGTRIVASWP